MGSMIRESGLSVRDINQHISKVAYKLNELKKMWKQRGIRFRSKVRIYRTLVISTMLYGAESRTCTQDEYARLNFFYTKSLRISAARTKSE